ncbi:hypothetical protein D9758_010980 [Tetrapyrgos nigripes]|uniref:Uncharacterized protein n=1 Tax=Tetrapyrgos nigripes TaxID=182062 RepID=A0A8H5GHI0_9AGAR|nr:hypothetical protein D9758_010980 [Tetrapyrgos nigripes]
MDASASRPASIRRYAEGLTLLQHANIRLREAFSHLGSVAYPTHTQTTGKQNDSVTITIAFYSLQIRHQSAGRLLEEEVARVRLKINRDETPTVLRLAQDIPKFHGKFKVTIFRLPSDCNNDLPRSYMLSVKESNLMNTNASLGIRRTFLLPVCHPKRFFISHYLKWLFFLHV